MDNSPHSPPRIEYIDHTADVGFRILAADPESAFAAAAETMFEIMVDREQVREAKHWAVDVTADDYEDLLVTFLEELLYGYESEHLVPHTCRIVEISPDHVRAELAGETLDQGRHDPRVQIKAVTYHQLKAGLGGDDFEVQVIFDI